MPSMQSAEPSSNVQVCDATKLKKEPEAGFNI